MRSRDEACPEGASTPRLQAPPSGFSRREGVLVRPALEHARPGRERLAAKRRIATVEQGRLDCMRAAGEVRWSSPKSPDCSQIDGTGVAWLVHSDLATTGQAKAGEPSPLLLGGVLGELDIFGSKVSHAPASSHMKNNSWPERREYPASESAKSRWSEDKHRPAVWKTSGSGPEVKLDH